MKRWVLQVLERVLGVEHPYSLRVASKMAQAMYAQGDLAGARALQQRVFAARERMLGTEHPATLGAANNLALTMGAQSDLAGARALQQRVFATFERVLGAEHPHTLIAAVNLAQTMSAQGDLVSARALQQRVFATRERELGAEHPHTLNAANNLAATMQVQGDLTGAQALQQRVFATFERVLGTDHPDTLTAANNLAMTMYAQGDLVGAQALQQRVFAIRERSLGAEHPDTLGAVDNLAMTMYAQGDLTGARALQQRVFATSERVLGAEHPDTLTAANNLASTMRTQGDLAGARMLLERVFATRERLLGAEHPDTLSAANNLALTMHDQGDLAGVRLLQRCLFANQRVLGAEHPHTLIAADNLALTMKTQGDLAGARMLQQRVFSAIERVLGAEHPSTLIAAGNLAATMRAQGDLTDARALSQRVFATIERVLGVEHPSTLNATDNLALTMLAQGDLVGAQALAVSLLRRIAGVADVGNIVFEGASHAALLLATDVVDDPGCQDSMCDHVELLAGVSRNLQSLLELREANAASTVSGSFAEFHRQWFRLCLHAAPERCPEAIAPLHGMEAWSAALGELLAAQASATLSPQQLSLLAARAALNDIRARITHIDARLLQVQGSDSSAGDVQAQQAWRERLRAELRAERDTEASRERAALAEYHVVREALAAADRTFAAALRPAQQRAADYAAQLRPGEAVLILFLIGEHGAFLIRADGRHGELALPDLNRFASRAREREELWRGGHRGGLRDWLDAYDFSAARLIEFDEPGPADASAGKGDAAPPKPPPTLADLQQAAGAGFWTPLREAFGEVRRWHIVTGPGQHTLPLEMGRTEVAARYYCGLPAYWRLRDRPLPLPAPGSGMDIAVDAAWGTRSPIPFVECEADLVRHIVTGRNTATRRRDGAALLDGRPLAARVQVACHGQAVGAVGRAHGVLVLDAVAGVVLEPARAAHLPGQMAELFASSCLGGVVGQTEGGDAQGMVPPLQLRGLPAIVACLAPVPDFYMPMLAALYWHARVAGVLPHEALEQAKLQLRSGNWPPELLTPVRAAYTARMTDVLERAAALDPGDRTVMGAARSVAGWCLPEEVRKKHFWKPPKQWSRKDLRGFVQERCASVDRRAALVTEVADRFIAGRHDLPAAARASIEHLCAYTVCFGDVAQAGDVA